MSDERDVQEVMARYVRAGDRSDEQAIAALFMHDGCVERFHHGGADPVLIGKVEGSARIGRDLARRNDDGSSVRWIHRLTHDAIVSIHGEKATIDLRFLAFGPTRDASRSLPEESTAIAVGIVIVDSGTFHANLKHGDTGWRITALRILHDLPSAEY